MIIASRTTRGETLRRHTAAAEKLRHKNHYKLQKKNASLEGNVEPVVSTSCDGFARPGNLLKGKKKEEKEKKGKIKKGSVPPICHHFCCVYYYPSRGKKYPCLERKQLYIHP